MDNNESQLLSRIQHDNAFLGSDPTIMVSTISLPDGRYETAVFISDRVEIVATYADAWNAAHGHLQYCLMTGCKNRVY